MNEKLKIWLAVSIPILLLVYVHLKAEIMMYRIEIGESADWVINVYGEPDKTETTMLFCDGILAWEGDCPSERYSLYHFYKKGIDRWVVLGYDSRRRVGFKTKGDL